MKPLIKSESIIKKKYFCIKIIENGYNNNQYIKYQ